MENGSVRNRPPRLSEISACLPWLQQQLEIIQPLVILCLGGPAANVIIHKDFKMTKERGIWFPTPYAGYAMAALHPVALVCEGTRLTGGGSTSEAQVEESCLQAVRAAAG